MNIKFDCKKYSGYKPCGFAQSCEICTSYVPMGKRVLIIKLAAMGDVLRTTTILKGLADKYEQLHITWITDKLSVPFLRYNSHIDTLMEFNWENIFILLSQKFDIVYNFEKEKRATAVATMVNANEKIGFSQTEAGAISIFNKESEYALQLGLDDPLKFHGNKKTYPEIIYEMAGLPYHGEDYELVPSHITNDFAEKFAKKHNLKDSKQTIIGLNTGCGDVFKTKKWPRKNVIKLIDLLYENGYKILLLGGPNEKEYNAEIVEEVGDKVLDTGCNNTIEEFMGIIKDCDLIVASDTLAMHLAIGLKRFVVTLIGSTSWTEIDLFGRGEKIITDFPCAPCYKKNCDKEPNCMEDIAPEQVFATIQKVLNKE